jgi:hypothetical protein
MKPNMHHHYTSSNIKILSIICWKNNNFIKLFIELREHNFPICIWNLHCTIYGIIILNITQFFFRVYTYFQIVANVFELST